MPYTFSEAARTLDYDVPLATLDALLAVCKEIDSSTPTDETDSFISSAHVALVTRLDGYGLPEELLTKIEVYLAAHFATLTYREVVRQTMTPFSETFSSKVDLGFNSTRYGQMAVSMDPTGKLAVADKRPVKMYSIGSGIITT